MLISAIVEPQPKRPGSKPRWIAFGVSWLLLTLYYWYVEKMKLIVAVILWGVFGLLPAWVLSSAYARTPGIRKQFSTILRPRGHLLWYLVAIFAIPIADFLGAEITRLLGGPDLLQLPFLGSLFMGIQPDAREHFSASVISFVHELLWK